MKYASLSVIGKDRPGIVAGITKVLFDHGCNLLDSSMTILGSEFAMILLLEASSDSSFGVLEKAISLQSLKYKLSYSLKQVSLNQTKKEVLKGVPYIVSVYGADKPGIVYKVSSFLAKNRINITDVQTNRTNSGNKQVYIMLLEVDLAKKTNLKKLKTALFSIAKSLNVNISLNPVDSYNL